MRFKTVHPKELGPAEFDRWRAHLRPGFDSPYLTPEWAQLIGETRDDARVCIINDGEAFWARSVFRASLQWASAPRSQIIKALSARPSSRSTLALSAAR